MPGIPEGLDCFRVAGFAEGERWAGGSLARIRGLEPQLAG
jgi:hypothetical protein